MKLAGNTKFLCHTEIRAGLDSAQKPKNIKKKSLIVFDFSGDRLYHAAAMSTGLPVQIHVQKAVAKATSLEGSLAVTRMPRLSSALLKDESVILAKLEFERGEDSHAYVRGSLDADLVMRCQRCMSEMIYHLHTDLDLRLIHVDASDDGDGEALEISDGYLQLYDFIEDEMILALPLVPTHENAQDCEQSPVPQKYLKHEVEGKRNPFAALQQLKPDSTSTR